LIRQSGIVFQNGDTHALPLDSANENATPSYEDRAGMACRSGLLDRQFHNWDRGDAIVTIVYNCTTITSSAHAGRGATIATWVHRSAASSAIRTVILFGPVNPSRGNRRCGAKRGTLLLIFGITPAFNRTASSWDFAQAARDRRLATGNRITSKGLRAAHQGNASDGGP
jgi:hypothetical protein